jgi:Na+/glutamate symporter
MEFAQFYQEGGVFMHAVTLLSLFVGVRLLGRVSGLRRTFRDPRQRLARLRQRDPLTIALLAAIVLAGGLGAALGWTDVHAALRTIPTEQWALAFSVGSQIAVYPLVWGLLCAEPLTLGHGVLAHFEQRLQLLIEEHA